MTESRESVDEVSSWQWAEPETVGLDDGRLQAMSAGIEAEAVRAVNGVLVARAGKLAYERYFNGFDASSLM
ncbi:MAG TPA: hypothetical protein VIP09_10100, partial [Dehalococcoidia bacterium]